MNKNKIIFKKIKNGGKICIKWLKLWVRGEKRKKIKELNGNGITQWDYPLCRDQKAYMRIF